MKFFLMTYIGKKRWNYSPRKIVRAASDRHALLLFGASNRDDWKCEEVPIEGKQEEILGEWIGDPG